MSFEGPCICEYCQRDRHCAWGDLKMLDCACACPNPRHYYNGMGQGGPSGVCGTKWRADASYFDTNIWSHVTCPDCLEMQPPTRGRARR